MNVLGIESSCDETSAAVIRDGVVCSNVIASQEIHKEFGGVVPELASRAHQQRILPVVSQALERASLRLDQLDGVAATSGPGLVGSLLVGLNFAKALAFGRDVRFLGVNHLEAHLYSGLLENPGLEYPFLCLLVSGGHTFLVLVREPFHHQVIGETLDDAAGEAYDKVAKMLGLGFPGGPIVDRLAHNGNPHLAEFPRSMLDDASFDFSFSGIKTAVLYWLRDHGLWSPSRRGVEITDEMKADLCASFQAAVMDILVGKTLRALNLFGVHSLTVAGGVSANSELRSRLATYSKTQGFQLTIPRLEYCTDNGAMVAFLGWLKFSAGLESPYDVAASSGMGL